MSNSEGNPISRHKNRKRTFHNCTGYVVAPWIAGAGQEPVSIRHSAAVPPWTDPDIHLHSDSEEYYLLLQGELQLLVDGAGFTLRPREVLMVKPNVPHAVVGGTGPIEHFVLRVPAGEDRRVVAALPAKPPVGMETREREVRADWGSRVPLTDGPHQNCWVFGVGQAHFHAERMCWAYMNFPNVATIRANRHRHCLHLHRESWEYYAVLRGMEALRVEQDLVEITAGEILAVPPQVKHVLHSTEPPFEGFTFRVPLLDDKVEF